MTRLRLFVPYLVIAVVHLVLLLFQSQYTAYTKLAIMPALLIAFLISLPRRRGNILVLGSVGILLSWSGDALISAPGEIGFLLGLGCFLLAHIAYLVLFIGPLHEKQIPRIAAVYAVWFVALIAILAPHLGVLIAPVVAYGLVLAAAAIAALGASGTAAVGAAAFLASDTLLAFDRFYPNFEFWQIDVSIMVLYIVGQGLIIYSAVSRANRLRGLPAR